MAAWHLSGIWRDRYRFEVTAPCSSRNRQRVVCLNVWRQAHGLAAEPLPELPDTSTSIRTNKLALVTSIQWETNDVKPPAEFVTRIESLKGRKLNGLEVAKLFADFAGEQPHGFDFLEFEAEKDERPTGVNLIIKLTEANQETAAGWRRRQRVLVGEGLLLDVTNKAEMNSFGSMSDWTDVVEGIKKANDAPGETPFQISVILREEK